MVATYETHAGAIFKGRLRLQYATDDVAHLPNRDDYGQIALFFKPGPLNWRWNPGGSNWVQDHRVDVSVIRISPERQPVISDNQEISVDITIPSTFCMSDLIEVAANDEIELTLSAAYVNARERISGNGPRGRTWDIARITVKRRPSIAILTGVDGSVSAGPPPPNARYFENAKTVFERWMRVVDVLDVRNLRGAITWLVENAPSSDLPWGMVHIVGHSDGHVWLINRWPLDEIPSVASRSGWYELEPTHIRSVAGELARNGHQPLASHVAADSEVVLHLCNFARDNTELLEATRSLFVAAPPVHGPALFVTFGSVDSGPQPAAGVVESVSRLRQNGSYQTVEISPNVLTSANFRHIR
jgi:hypothetical protein